MSATPLQLMHFEGGDALSAFRAQALARPPAGRLPAHHGAWPRATCIGWRLTCVTPRHRQDCRTCSTTARPTAGPDGRRTGTGDAAPGYRQPLGQQGHRHCAQLRRGVAPGGACHRIPPGAEGRPARSRQTPDRCRTPSRGRVAARPHDRTRGLRARSRRPSVRRRCRPSPWFMWTCWARAAMPWSRRTAEFGLALSDDEIDYLVARPLAGCSATPAMWN
jgi:phosphoribosylformylglycinamidine synthase